MNCTICKTLLRYYPTNQAEVTLRNVPLGNRHFCVNLKCPKRWESVRGVAVMDCPAFDVRLLPEFGGEK